jgi:hypothetical protein
VGVLFENILWNTIGAYGNRLRTSLKTCEKTLRIFGNILGSIENFVFSFPERLQPITAVAMCTVAVNFLEPGAFNPESQYFIPRFNQIS